MQTNKKELKNTLSVQKENQKEKRYNRKTKQELKEHKYYKCGFPECLKNFHDYSSLYTHIKLTHQGIIHPDTVSKPPKKTELLEWLKNEKGNIIQDPTFSIDVDEVVTYFFDRYELLQTYLIFQALLSQDHKFSQFFHQEDEEYFNLELLQSTEDFEDLFDKKYLKEIIILQEYLKPFEQKTAIELARIIQIIIFNQNLLLEDILLAIQESIQQNQHLFTSIGQLNLDMFYEGLIEEFLAAAQELPDEYLYTIQNQSEYSSLIKKQQNQEPYKNQNNLGLLPQESQQSQNQFQRQSSYEVQNLGQSIYFPQQKKQNSFKLQPQQSNNSMYQNYDNEDQQLQNINNENIQIQQLLNKHTLQNINNLNNKNN